MSISTYSRDTEVVHRLRPEPITADEQAVLTSLDETDFEIFRHKMDMIAQEGKETTMKLGASTGMRWGDVAFGVYTAQGDLASVATGIWFHAVLGQIPIKYIVKHWIDNPSVGVKPGDSFFFNDAQLCGVHTADMGLAVPVFVDGKLVCFVGAVVHTGESGSTDPGGMSNTARSRYDDGLKITPLKIGENYQLRDDVLAVFAAATRDPRTMILDIKARLAACRLAERRILELINQRGPEFFVGALRHILTVTGEGAKRKVSLLNDGVFRMPRFFDTVGLNEGLVKIGVTLTKKGDQLHLDFDDTSPMLPDRPVNTYFQGLIGLACTYLCGWFFYDLPANNGLLEALSWQVPDNAVVNAQGDAPTSISPFPQTAFVQGMFHMGAKLTYTFDPLRAVAPWYTGFGCPIFGGINQWGEPVADVTAELNATGCGGRPDMDGVDCSGSFFATMSDCSDVETTEADRPFLYQFRSYTQHSYGHGKHRGGSGLGFSLMMHHVPWVALGAFGYGSKFPASLGLFGGYAAPPVFIETVRGSNLRQLLADGNPSIPRTFDELYDESNPERGQRDFLHITNSVSPYLNGDTFKVPVGGGAGYGDVLERDPEAVLKDLREGLTTEWAARNIYKVAFEAATFRLDAQATEELRAAARAERLRKGRPFKEFQAEWGQLRPPEHVLAYYGTYPHPREGIQAAAQGR